MASSPSSCLNTPGGGGGVPTPSPCSLQEDTAYRDKIRQLSKYIEPLRRMINRVGNDGMYYKNYSTYMCHVSHVILYNFSPIVIVIMHYLVSRTK
jgi:hypothetical protein